EQPWSAIVDAAGNNPLAVGRPAYRFLNVDRLRERLEIAAICGQDVEAQFSLSPQDHCHLMSIGRDRRRLEQGFVRSLQDLHSLAVLETPQTVASALRGQVKQRPPGKPRRE